MNLVDTPDWEEALREQAVRALRDAAPQAAALQSPGDLPLTLLSHNRTVADGQTAYLLGQTFVLLVSAVQFPDASAIEVQKMADMRACLGAPAGRVLLDVQGHGRAQGRSFLIVARCKPLPQGRVARRVASWRVRGDLLQWLRELTALAQAPDPAAQQEFLASLAALSAMALLPAPLRHAAQRQMERLQAGQAQARHMPMHGDLWTGNVMHRPDGRLAIIDWGGSVVRGYGVYDLVRAADSLGLSRRRLARELAWHAQALGDAQQGAQLHLLAALGHYARHLGEFPAQQFAVLASRCCARLEAALGRPLSSC